MPKMLSILEWTLLIAIAMLLSTSGIMATGTTPVVQHIGSFSFGTSSVGQTNTLLSGVLPVDINQGNGLLSGQLPTPIALSSLNAKRTTIQLDQAMPSVSVIPIGTNTLTVVNNQVNRTVPMVVAKPLNRSEPEVVTVPQNGTKPLNATNPTNITQPLNATQPLNTTMS